MPHPLERERELAEIDDALQRGASGDGALVVIQAGPGLGKSSLLECAAERAGHLGMRVLRAVGSPLELTFAFGVVLQMLAPVVRQADDEAFDDLFSSGAASAAPLLMGGDLGALELSTFGALNALYWFTVNLAERQPIALLVDDLHWADAPSIRFLAYLSTRLGGVPATTVIATRPPDGPEAAEELDHLIGAPDAQHLQPSPLTPQAVVSLVRAWREDADDEFCAACARVTAGNPLFLRELLIALENEDVQPAAHSVGVVEEVGPAPVSRAVFVTLRRLGPEATAFARALAILGDGAAVSEVAAVAGLELDVAVTTASALMASAIVRGGDALSFEHPIVRQALWEELQPVERAHGHGRAARVLLETGARPARVAAQLLEAPPEADVRAVDMLEAAAAEALGRGDPHSAVKLLSRALDEPPPAPRTHATLLALGRAEFQAGHPRAVDHLRQATATAAEPRDRGVAALALGRAYYAAGRFTDAVELLADARDSVRDVDSELAAELNANWAASLIWSGREEAEQLVPIHELVDPDREPRVLGERQLMANVAGFAALQGLDRERATRQALTAWGDGRLLDEAGVDEPSIWAITAVLQWGDEWREAEAVVDATIDRARREGSFLSYATGCYVRSALWMWRGRLARAAADIDVALGARAQGWETFAAAALWIRGEILLEQGKVDEAVELLTITPEEEERWSTNPSFITTLGTRAFVELARGRPRDALRAAQQAGQLARGAFASWSPAVAPWAAAAGLATARLGDVEAARTWCDMEVEQARVWGAAWPLARAQRFRAVIERPADAIPMLEAALQTLEPTEANLERTHVLVDLGAALRAAGHRVESRGPLADGLELARSCNATALADRAQAELTMAGARPRRASSTGVASLTPSEFRVADLAARGLSNREIAEALFVTKKAVEYHLSNVYRKLDVNRAGLAGTLGPGDPQADSVLPSS